MQQGSGDTACLHSLLRAVQFHITIEIGSACSTTRQNMYNTTCAGCTGEFLVLAGPAWLHQLCMQLFVWQRLKHKHEQHTCSCLMTTASSACGWSDGSPVEQMRHHDGAGSICYMKQNTHAKVTAQGSSATNYMCLQVSLLAVIALIGECWLLVMPCIVL
jgi:hypothetical protein